MEVEDTPRLDKTPSTPIHAEEEETPGKTPDPDLPDLNSSTKKLNDDVVDLALELESGAFTDDLNLAKVEMEGSWVMIVARRFTLHAEDDAGDVEEPPSEAGARGRTIDHFHGPWQVKGAVRNIQFFAKTERSKPKWTVSRNHFKTFFDNSKRLCKSPLRSLQAVAF